MLSRKTPLRPKTPLKSGGSSMKRTPLRRVSVKKARETKRYWPIRKAFLERVPYCEICVSRKTKLHLDEVRSNAIPSRVKLWYIASPSVEIHHLFSRNGSLLCDERGFVASCRACRDYPKDHPEEARKLGLLGKASEIGVPIDLHKKD